MEHGTGVMRNMNKSSSAAGIDSNMKTNTTIPTIRTNTAQKTGAKSGRVPWPTQKTGLPSSRGADSEWALRLQQELGNQAVQRLFKSGSIQAKLKIGPPNDIYEQEADRVADQVMRMPAPAIQPKPG
jgi:hypothetical protein